MDELNDLLIVQKLVAKNIEIANSIPEYNGQSDIDKFYIQLAQFVQITINRPRSVKRHAPTTIKRPGLNLSKTD